MNPIRWHLLVIGGTTFSLAWVHHAPIRRHVEDEAAGLARHLRHVIQECRIEMSVIREFLVAEMADLARVFLEIPNEF
jgi:hypothetical protein